MSSGTKEGHRQLNVSKTPTWVLQPIFDLHYITQQNRPCLTQYATHFWYKVICHLTYCKALLVGLTFTAKFPSNGSQSSGASGLKSALKGTSLHCLSTSTGYPWLPTSNSSHQCLHPRIVVCHHGTQCNHSPDLSCLWFPIGGISY